MSIRKLILAGILLCTAQCGSHLLAQASIDDVTELKRRVAQLEKQVQELSRVIEPLRTRQSAEARQKARRNKFDEKIAKDRSAYTPEQLREAEQLYQVANQKWGSPEALESLQKMIRKYPDINRTGCALLYVAQRSEGEVRTGYLQQCIEKHNDCFYGDGVQVGAYARFLLAHDYDKQGEKEKAVVLYKDLKTQYPDSIDHSGKRLVEALDAERN